MDLHVRTYLHLKPIVKRLLTNSKLFRIDVRVKRRCTHTISGCMVPASETGNGICTVTRLAVQSHGGRNCICIHRWCSSAGVAFRGRYCRRRTFWYTGRIFRSYEARSSRASLKFANLGLDSCFKIHHDPHHLPTRHRYRWAHRALSCGETLPSNFSCFREHADTLMSGKDLKSVDLCNTMYEKTCCDIAP